LVKIWRLPGGSWPLTTREVADAAATSSKAAATQTAAQIIGSLIKALGYPTWLIMPC